MTKKSAAFLRVLFNRFHQGPSEGLLHGLPPEEQDAVKSFDTPSQSIEAAVKSPEARLLDVHYSWLMPAMKELPKGVDTLVLGALPEALRDPLKKQLKKKGKFIEPSPPAKAFILDMFTPYFINGDEILPIEFIPNTPLTPLLALTKKQLVCLIDFLAIYDLAAEVRHIVDRKVIEKYHKCLTKKEKEFLNHCLHKKERLITAPLSLKDWKGDSQSLRKILHRRGLNRLGYALSSQHTDFIWHLAHNLDSGRGEFLMKCAKHPVEHDVTQALIRQIQRLLKFLCFNP